MIGESQVIIGAEIDHLAPIGKPNHRALRRSQDLLALQQSRRIERLRFARKPLAEFL